MSNYSILAGDLKGRILRFSKRITKNIGKPEQKLTANLFYGIAESGSCVLSEVSRSLKEDIKVKKTQERLARGLRDFSEQERQNLLDDYNKITCKNIDENTVYDFDGSDMTKPYGKAFEGLAPVHDGSTGEIKPGFWTLEVVALTHGSKTPIPVYDHVYSTQEQSYVSQNAETIKALRYIQQTFGSGGIRTFDRGYDAGENYKYFHKHQEEHFIIRADKTRNIKWQGKTKNILSVANHYKGRTNLEFRDKKGKSIGCKTTIIPVALPTYPNWKLNMIVVYGLGSEPLILLTNLQANDLRLANTVAKIYLMRWRIEEHFRFKKQQFRLEGFRVRSLNAIRALHRIVMLLAGFIALLSDKRDESLFVLELISISKRTNKYSKEKAKTVFLGYALAYSIATILRRCSKGIAHLLVSKTKDSQIAFFLG